MSAISKRGWGYILVVLGAIFAVILAFGWLGTKYGQLWLAGGAGLGVLAGCATGASEKPGTTLEFVKVLGAGLVVPIIGAFSGMAQKLQSVTETMAYSGERIIEKNTETSEALVYGDAHFTEIVGAFFLVYSVAALMGFFGGISIRQGGGGAKG